MGLNITVILVGQLGLGRRIITFLKGGAFFCFCFLNFRGSPHPCSWHSDFGEMMYCTRGGGGGGYG